MSGVTLKCSCQIKFLFSQLNSLLSAQDKYTLTILRKHVEVLSCYCSYISGNNSYLWATEAVIYIPSIVQVVQIDTQMTSCHTPFLLATGRKWKNEGSSIFHLHIITVQPSVSYFSSIWQPDWQKPLVKSCLNNMKPRWQVCKLVHAIENYQLKMFSWMENGS